MNGLIFYAQYMGICTLASRMPSVLRTNSCHMLVYTRTSSLLSSSSPCVGSSSSSSSSPCITGRQPYIITRIVRYDGMLAYCLCHVSLHQFTRKELGLNVCNSECQGANSTVLALLVKQPRNGAQEMSACRGFYQNLTTKYDKFPSFRHIRAI
jgi:hypothetical protein